MNYEEMFRRITAAFPPGTVISSGANRAYIPVQVYQKRLEQVLGEHWSWRIIDMPEIHYERRTVMVKGELQIFNTVRQAIGFTQYRGDEAGHLRNAIAIAEAEAFRNCCDYFQMGWIDLAPYRDWSSNPGIRLSSEPQTHSIISSQPGTGEQQRNENICTKCQKPLIAEDILMLELHNIKLKFCIEHIPKHFLKRKE